MQIVVGTIGPLAVGSRDVLDFEIRPDINRLCLCGRQVTAMIAADVVGKPLMDVMMAAAPLNTMLDLLPAAQRDELLTAFVNMTN